MRSPARPLAVPPFRRLVVAWAAAALGFGLFGSAAAWTTWEATGSSLVVSIVAAAPFLPQLVLSLPAGALADRWDRRRIALVASTALAAAGWLAAAAATGGWLGVPVLLTAASLLGVGLAVGIPAQATWIPELAGPGNLTTAIAANAAANKVAKVVGLVVSGLLLGSGRVTEAFALGAVGMSAMLAAVAVSQPDDRVDPDPSPSGSRPWRGILEDPGLRRPIVALATFAALGMPVQTLLPGLLGRGRAGSYGLLLTAFAVGGVLGAAGRSGRRELSVQRALGWGIGAMGVGTVVVALVDPLLLRALGLVLCGASWVWLYTSVNTAVQERAPARVVSRAMSLFTVAGLGAIPFGLAIGGAMADRLGETAVLLALAAGQFALLSWWHRGRRTFTDDIPATGGRLAGAQVVPDG